MLLNLVTPASVPFGDAPVTGLNLFNVTIDPDGLTATAYMTQVGGVQGPGTSRQVKVPITGSMTMTQLLAAIKAQAATQFSCTFQ